MKYLKLFEGRNKYDDIEKVRAFFKELVGDEYEVLDKSNDKTKIKIKHNICGNVYEPRISSFINDGRRCSVCSKPHTRNTIDSLIKRCKDINVDDYSIIDTSEYVNNKSKITVKHNICGYVFNPRIDNFFNKKSGCPKCASNIRLTIEEIKDKFYEIHPTGYKLELEEQPKNGRSLIKVIHDCGNSWFATLSNLLYNKTGCPFCKMSKGEKLIKKYLDDNKILYRSEFRFTDLKNSRPLPFDFYLPDYNMCIEYDGIQHFIPIEYFGGEKSLIYNQMIDKKKSDYCSEKGIKLVRLTYLDIKKIRQLLDEVFNEL